MKLLSKVLLAIALAAAGTGLVVSCDNKPITPPDPNPILPEKSVTFKVGDKLELIKLTSEGKLVKQPSEVQVPEGKEFKGWKVEGQEDSTAVKTLPETFSESVVYVAVFGDKEIELQEAPIVFKGYGQNHSIRFTFQGVDTSNLTKKLKNSAKATLKEYYKSRLILNGVEDPKIDKFGLSIKDGIISLYNITGEFNTELVIKKGTIFKAQDKNDNIVSLVKSDRDLKLRYNGTEFIESDVELVDKTATGIEVDSENKELTHEMPEGVDFVVTFTPEDSIGKITAELEQADEETEVTVKGNSVNVFTTKMPSEETVLRIVIKLVGTDIRKVVTVTIPKYEEPVITQVVTFEPNGGQMENTTVVVNTGQKVSAPAVAPTKEGYTFAGWYKDQELQTLFNFEETEITEPTTIYAKWTQNEYTVTFNLDNGSLPEGKEASVKVLHGNSVENPGEPTKEGYTFKGWFADESKLQSFEFTTQIKGNTQVYAKWEINEGVKLTFDLQGGEMLGDHYVKVATGETVTAPSQNPTKVGHTFVKWVTEANGDTEYVFGQLNEDTTIYAKWTINSYNVTFDLAGGETSETNNPVSVEHGSTVSQPSFTPTKEGHKFIGWTKEQGSTTQFEFTTEKVEAELTLFAIWELNTYTVTFELNDGVLTENTKTVSHGQKVDRPENPTKEGYNFAGWYKEAGFNTEFNFETEVITQATTVYAKWTKKTYTVTFMVEDGELTPDKKTKTVEHGDKVTSETPTKVGYTFEKWYSNTELTVEFDFENTTITENKVLYPKWIINTYSVIFNVGDGSTSVETATVNHGEKVEKPENPTKEGHTFVKWVKQQDGDEEFSFETEEITAETNLYAKWEVNSYTVTFVIGEDATMEGQEVKVNWNTLVARPSTNPQKENYNFVNWYTSETFETEFDFNATTVTDNLSIYAKFERIIVESTVSSVSETDEHSPLVLSFGENVVLSQDISKQNIEDTTVLDAIKAKITGKTLDYIKYEDNKIKVYFNNDNNSLKNGEKITVLADLPLYQFIDGSYVQVAKSTNELVLVSIDGNFKPIQTGNKNFTLEYKVSDSSKKYGYKAVNANVSSFTVENGLIKAVFEYKSEEESILSIYMSDEEIADHVVTEDNLTAKLVYDYKIGLYYTQKNEQSVSKYTEQGMEEFVNVSYEEGKHNVLVIFASKNLGQDTPKLHYWGFNQSPTWETRPQMHRLHREKQVYGYLISATKHADELGFIITRSSSEAKFTGDVKSTNEAISSYFDNFENGLKILYIYSDDESGTNDNVVLGYSGNHQAFLEKLNQ